MSTASLSVKLFADGADLGDIAKMAQNPAIQGFTTNPTLMRKAGISDYCAFSKQVLEIVPERPVSFEVFSDDFSEMKDQAREIASWGSNVYVKIPITNTLGQSSASLIRDLSYAGVQVNATALMTTAQVQEVLDHFSPDTKGFISVFAGRIADTGRDPVPVMAEAVRLMQSHPKLELIWASPRELLNVFQADSVGCHVLTATTDILKKLPLIGKDLDEFSLDTVKMFRRDAVSAGFEIPLTSVGSQAVKVEAII
jgi:transaldolase